MSPIKLKGLMIIVFMMIFGINQGMCADLHKVRADIEKKITQFHFDELETRIGDLQSPGYEAFYRANQLIYKYLCSQEVTYIQQLRGQWKNTVEAIEGLAKTDSLKLVMLSELHCKRAIIEFLNKNYLTSVRYARQSRALALRNQKDFSAPEQLKVLGLFNVTLGAVPRKYQWITNTLGFRGNVEVGLQQLEEAAAKGTIMRQEAVFISYFVRRSMLNQSEEAIEKLLKERETAGPNILLDYFLASAWMNIKKNEEAIEILSHRNTYVNDQVYFIPYWDYLLGKAYYFNTDYRQAQRYFSRFLKAFKGKFFRMDATFRLGMALTLDGSYNLGKRFFRLVSEGEESGLGEDEYAIYMSKKFLDVPPNENMSLLFKARNLYDGGYFEEAINTFKSLNVSVLDTTSQTEWYYRYARVLHDQGQFETALINYQQCLNVPLSKSLGQSEQIWLHAYAHYYQAEIAKEQSDIATAKVHYDEALSYDNYFYQSGLENRCKIAISELKKLE